MTGRRWLFVALAAAALFLIAGRALAGLYVDYRWYQALGAAAVWRAQTANALILRLLLASAGSAFVFANLWAVRQSVVSLVLPRRVANIEIGEEVPRRYLAAAVVAMSLVLGALLTVPEVDWTTLALWRYGVPFGESDPYFATDLGYYVYWLPLERSIYLWAIFALALVVAVVVFLYALTPSLRWERGTLRVSGWVRRHLTVLGVLLLFVLAWSYRLDAYETLSGGSGAGGAFTAVDRSVVIPANLVLAALTLAISLLVLWAGWTGQTRVAFAAISTVVVLSLGLRQALPVLVRRFAQPVDPARREAAYVATALSFTRRAYGTDHVALADPASAYAGLAQAAPLVPLWDPAVLTRTVERTPAGGTAEPVVAWHVEPRGVVGDLVVRPPPGETGAAALTGWTTVRVSGVEVDERGGPLRLARSGQPGDEPTPLPTVAFADSAGGYVVVSDSGGRLAAAELESWQSRLAHAWSRQDWRLVFADIPQPAPRILLRRGVRERVEAIAPFFAQDRTVSPVLLGDSLYWMVHLYSASAEYPLSRRARVGEPEWSYFQHAAVAVVNAHTGRVGIVADSVQDPVARSWTGAFPQMFTSWSELPSGLAALAPPALDGALAQAQAIAWCNASPSCTEVRGAPGSARVTGVASPDSARTLAAEPIFLLPGGVGTKTWSAPIVDAGDRVVGLVVATGGAAPRTTWFPIQGDDAAGRWPAVLARLSVARDSLAPAAGTSVRAGRLRALPVRGEAAFVQPFYQMRPDGTAALARVALAAGDSAARSGATLVSAAGVAGGAAHGAAGGPSVAPGDFRARVAALYDAMQAALRRNDLAAFGAAYAKLGALLGRHAP